MKKFFGTIFLLIGLVLTGFGVYGLTISVSIPYSGFGPPPIFIAIVLIIFGIIFLIIGIVMLVTKTNSQRKNEMELELLKRMQLQSNSPDMKNNSVLDSTSTSNELTEVKISQLEKLANLKAQGIISEDEFAIQKKKILN